MQIIEYVVDSIIAKIFVVIIMIIWVHKYQYTKKISVKESQIHNIFRNNGYTSYRNQSYIYYLW